MILIVILEIVYSIFTDLIQSFGFDKDKEVGFE